MNLVISTPTQQAQMMYARYAPLLKLFGVIAIILGAMAFLMISVEAASTTAREFDASATKLEAWIKGNLGKSIVLGGLIFGLAAFAWTRDMKALFLPLIGAVVLAVVISVINASFTAVI